LGKNDWGDKKRQDWRYGTENMKIGQKIGKGKKSSFLGKMRKKGEKRLF
jgi:hypothetical protein